MLLAEGVLAKWLTSVAEGGWRVHVEPEAIIGNAFIQIEEAFLPYILGLFGEEVQEFSAVRESLSVVWIGTVHDQGSVGCSHVLTGDIVGETSVEHQDHLLTPIVQVVGVLLESSECSLIHSEVSESVHVVAIEPHRLQRSIVLLVFGNDVLHLSEVVPRVGGCVPAECPERRQLRLSNELLVAGNDLLG